MTNPSNLWLETRSKIQDREHRDREARTHIFWAYKVNTGNWEGERAPATKLLVLPLGSQKSFSVLYTIKQFSICDVITTETFISSQQRVKHFMKNALVFWNLPFQLIEIAAMERTWNICIRNKLRNAIENTFQHLNTFSESTFLTNV